MRKLKSVVAAILAIAWVSLSGASAGDAGPMVPFKTYSNYFVSNTHTFPPGQKVEYLHIDDMDRFDEIFGLATVMYMTPAVVKTDVFSNNIVLAVIRDGLWDMRTDYVVDKPDGLEIHYHAQALPATYEAVTPLVISVPKNGAGIFKFIENGTLTHVITDDDVETTGERFPHVSVAGRWSRKAPVDPEARAVFDRAMDGHSGSRFEPVYFSSQKANGRNYRFSCLQTVITDPPKHGLATVTFHVAPGGEVSGLHIEGMGR